MKRKGSIVVFILLFTAVAMLSLFGCENKKTDLPSTAYEKVGFAFNGVEKSFSSASGAKNAAPAGGSKIYAAKNDEALNVIRGLYIETDKETWNGEEVDYDQPPMQQFHYLKAVFENIGSDYAFGTKYHDVVEGYMYFDDETGYRVRSDAADAESRKYAYRIDFAMSIVIDENDLIFSEVSFEITLTKGAEQKRTYWYVSFDLDYDMESSTPNYKMLMLTDNKEGDLPYLHRPQGYEYDYVEVRDNEIVEWRKFGLEAEKELVFDQAHASFSDYEREGLAYSADTCKWYNGREYNKIKQKTPEKESALATALVDGLGLNSTNIKSAAFFTKTGVRSEAISAFYRTISDMIGEELVYELVCKKEDKERESVGWPTNFLQQQGIADRIPSLEATATVAYTVSFGTREGQNYAMLTLSGAWSEALEGYKATLIENGFIRSDSGTAEIYVLPRNDGKIPTVMIERNVVYLIGADAGSGGQEKAVVIEYVGEFRGVYASYSQETIFEKDVAPTIADFSGGMVSAEAIAGYVSGTGTKYNIVLIGNGDAAAIAENAYELFMQSLGDAPWFAQGAPVRYFTDDHRNLDVVVLVNDGVDESGVPVLDIYVFTFTKGSVKEITASMQGGGQGGQGQGGQGQGGQGQGGQGQGGEGQGGEGEGENTTTNVYVWTVGESGKEPYAQNSCNNGEEIDVWEYAQSDDRIIYCLYSDEGCAQMIPIDSIVYANGEDINIYRKEVEEDYVGVTFHRYMNGAFLSKKTVVYRKGQIVYSLSDGISDVGGEFLVYRSADQNDQVDQSKRQIFMESTTLYAYGKSAEYTAYDIVANGEVIMRIATNYISLGSEGEIHGESVHIMATATAINGNVVEVTDVKYEKSFAHAYAYNGHEVYREEWYFTDKYAWSIAENDLWYTDASLTAHTSYTGDEQGVHNFTANVTLWGEYDGRSYRSWS